MLRTSRAALRAARLASTSATPPPGDLILLRGLLFHAHHGVLAAEQELGQKFRLDLSLEVDLRPLALTGNKVEKVCDAVHITLNKNSVFGDASAVSPGGVRVGSPAMTSRGLTPADFVTIAGFLDRAVQLALSIQAVSGKGLKEFVGALEGHAEVAALRGEVEAFAEAFPMPGFEASMIGV